jgi:hypothetical protein
MELSIFFLRCLKPEFQKAIAKGILLTFFRMKKEVTEGKRNQKHKIKN